MTYFRKTTYFIFAAIILFGSSACKLTKKASSKAGKPLLQTDYLSNNTFLALTDIHYDATAAGNWYGHKDETDDVLLERAIIKAKKLVATTKPAFVVYLGDMPGHNQTIAHRKQSIKKVLKSLRAIVADTNIPLLYAHGNNDGIQANYGSFTDKTDLPKAAAGVTPFSLDAGHEKDWPILNGKDKMIDDTELSLGYYAAYPLEKPKMDQMGLRAIMLNTVIFTKNYNSQDGITQAQAIHQQMTWLTHQLQDAANKKEAILLAMHVPPGKDGYSNAKKGTWGDGLSYNNQPLNNAFLQLIAEYKDNIIGLLSSHTHTDGIRRLYNQKGAFVELCISIPSVTTDHGNNPALKILNFNPANNYELQDFTTYYADEVTKNWSADSFYSFGQTYNKPTTDSTLSMYEWIHTLTSRSVTDSLFVAKQMNAILHVKNEKKEFNKAGYRKAIDVKWAY